MTVWKSLPPQFSRLSMGAMKGGFHALRRPLTDQEKALRDEVRKFVRMRFRPISTGPWTDESKFP
jgi:hypothetical protein